MDKQKQIEEIARDIDEFCQKELGAVFNDDILANFAEHLYNAGCRKQSEGEWIAKGTMIRTPSAINYTCSLCGLKSARTTPFCPGCGAKMKGGE